MIVNCVLILGIKGLEKNYFLLKEILSDVILMQDIEILVIDFS